RTLEDARPGPDADGAAALRRSQPAGLEAVLGTRLVVEPGCEAAVAAALGPALGALAFRDAAASRAALAWLGGQAAGRAVLVALDCDSDSSEEDAALRDAVQRVDIGVRLLAEAVGGEPEYRA